MLKKYYPWEHVKSVHDINYTKLYDLGYRGIIFDIDNTLVHHGDDSTPKIDQLFKDIQAIGFKTLLLSNNDEERVERFIKNIDTLYVCDADKPDIKGYKKAVELLGMDQDEIVCVGDQVFTDIYGANRIGMASILVDFIRLDSETRIGRKRYVEKIILKFYKRDKKMSKRLGGISKNMPRKKLFCELNPTCYAISQKKEILKRSLKNAADKEKYAALQSDEKLPVLVSSYSSQLIKRGKGIDPVLQENKAVNIGIAGGKMNGLIIHPGESFSFWGRVGNTTKKNGYKEGRVIEKGILKPGMGGGLCNLSNTVHNLVLRSPLTVTEFHSHSDALAPDHGKRVPFSSGTSVSYNNIDYRFKNNTDQNFQLLIWCEDDMLKAELRTDKELPNTYRIVEEDHHFSKEGDKYYRISKIYQETIDENGNLVDRKLVLDNHSEVMFDYSDIPQDQIR